MRLDDLISGQAAIRGEAPALTVKDATLTYAELARATAEFGAALTANGLRRGDRVAVYLDKRIETVVATFGTAAAGGAFVPINPLLRPAQVGHILADSGARFLVTSAERLETLGEELDGASALEQTVLAGDWDEFVAAAQRAEAPAPAPAIDVDMAAIFYTSGSTGRPKGVVLSHRNLLAGAESVVEYLGNDEGDRILSVLPLSFDAGFSQLTTGFAAGAHVVMTEYLLPRDVVKLCAAHGITGLTGVPPLWVQLADQKWPAEATENLRYFASTGGRMPRATLDRLREIFPAAAPFLMYGLTEAFRSTYLDPAEVDARPDSIGKAIPNAEVMVVREDGTRCDPGEQGELVHRGALVAMGYWNDPETTAERFRPAPGRPDAIPVPETAVWSGDRVVEDEEGFLYFVGRGDEMIKTSGYRVSPSEVEEAAFETGLVRDAVAVGIEDPRIGQRIAIAVAPAGEAGSLEPDALLGELRRQLPAYMVPREVEVLPELPRSPNGKYDRTAIRERLGER
jgi:acyl-CoA ligase (AMP-forming) (exosortase A-associated)